MRHNSPPRDDRRGKPRGSVHRPRWTAAGKKVRWYSNVDYLTGLAGLVALAGSAMALADAIIVGFPDYLGDFKTPPPLYLLPSIYSLIIYGVISGIVWTCSARAVMNILSLEINGQLSRGINIDDLTNVFEWKFGTRWLLWRRRLWKSSFFAVLCVCCYISFGLLYRLAFTPRDVEECSDTKEVLDFILGCPYQTGLSTYSTLQHLTANPKLFSTASAVIMESVKSDWTVEYGWRGNSVEKWIVDGSLSSKNYGTFEAQHIIAVSQSVAGWTTQYWHGNTLNYSVGAHPKCGKLLQVCADAADETGVASPCFWIGISSGLFSVTKSGVIEDDGDLSLVLSDGKLDPAASDCPMQLNATIYERVIRDMASELQVPGGLWGLNSVDPITEGLVIPLLISHVNADLDMILEPSRSILLSAKILTANISHCGSADFDGHNLLTGNFCEPVSTRYFPIYQYAASGVLFFWGFLLVIAAYPYRGLVVERKLLQWMSFGADVGVQDMNAAIACANRNGSRAAPVYELILKGDGNSNRYVGLAKVNRRSGVSRGGVSRDGYQTVMGWDREIDLPDRRT
ncbi:hypothetical protein F5882DRAFT_446547 [Hyaloscypha sp. PMI_1271]|nr:hypothetical protein F5882DRAFT_446547 [Hyaloscypha sp. PMI_1271]